MERVCFLGRVKAERLAEYRARHERVWPDMLAALQEAGWGNYSLFLTEDGLLVYESSGRADPPEVPGLEQRTSRKYGSARLTLYDR